MSQTGATPQRPTAWWKEVVVYQVYPRSFNDSNGDGIGDLNGITAKLDYLKQLGIDVVWLSPHFDSPNADNGYDIRDYREVLAEFGTMADFDRMLQAMRASGMVASTRHASGRSMRCARATIARCACRCITGPSCWESSSLPSS